MKVKLLSLITIISIITSFIPNALAEDVRTDGLVGYWSFDNETTETVQSEVNTDTWGTPLKIGSKIRAGQEGQVGTSFRFVKKMDDTRVGEENYINVGQVPDDIVNAKELSFSMWIRPAGYAWFQTLVSFHDPTKPDSNAPFSVHFESGKLKPQINGNTLGVEKALPANEWYFVTVTLNFNGKFDFKAYVDGTSIGSRNISPYTNYDFGAYDMWIGARYWKNGTQQDDFNGYMDDVRLYNKVLSADEVAQLYDSYKIASKAEKNTAKMYSYNKISDDNYIDVALTNDTYNEVLDTSMFTAEGLPEGMEISSVEYTDKTHARVYITGTPTSDITEDTEFTVKVLSAAGKLSCIDGNAIECVLQKPDKFVVEAETVKNGNTIELNGKIVNTFNVTQSAAALIGIYDGNMLKKSVITDITDLEKNAEQAISESIDVTGFTEPSVAVYVWDKLPDFDEDNNASGGQVMAGSYTYPEDNTEAEVSENTDIIIDIDSTDETVTISGSLTGEKASVMVYLENDGERKTDYFKEFKVSNDGSFKHTYKMNNPVDDVPYKVFITDENGTVSKEFKYYSADYREEILAEAKGKSGDDFVSYVEEQQYVLDIDLSDNGAYGLLSEQAKTDFWTELEKGINDCKNQTEFKAFFNKTASDMTLTDKVNLAESAEALIAIIEAENSTLGFNLNDDYEEYKTEITKAMLSPVYHSLDEVKAGYENTFYITVFNSIDYTDRTTMLEKLEKYKTELGIDEDFFGTKKNTYVKYMMGIDFTDKADIKKKADEAIVKGNSSGSTSTGGSSSGSSGGGYSGGGSSANVPIFDNSTIQKPIITAEEANAVFSDLDSVDWAKEAIEALAAKQVVSGKAEKTFAPNDLVTRAEFAKMIVLAFGSYNENLATQSFSDVTSEDWFYPYVANAESRKVINGRDDGTFGVYNNITREDMCVMVYRQLEALSKAPENTGVQFGDEALISDYALEAVLALKSGGIVNGVDESNFAPKESCTRAMAAKVIYSALSLN